MRLSLFWRLALILFLFYMTLRGQFLHWNAHLFLTENKLDILRAFWLGIPFDLVAIAWTLVPVLLWGWFVRGFYWIPFFLIQIPLWILNVIDIEMWNFWGRRMTFSSLEILREGQGKAFAIAENFLGWIVLAACIGFLFWGAAVWVFKNQAKHPFAWKSKAVILEQFIIVVLLILGTRGGIQKKPLTPVNADHFIQSHMNQLTLNTSFMLFKTFKKTSLTRAEFFADKNQALQLVNGGWSAHPYLPQISSSSKQNVVIIILESFSWEYTSLNPNITKSYTPFLDQLMKKSLSFPRAMASGRRSIEGVAAILSGIPALMEEPFITSEFSTNQFTGIGHVFSKAGFDTSFYHGGDNGTMHFDSFTAKSGIQNYYGSKEYPKPQDHDGVWGVWDRPYLQYFAEELSKKKEPFLSIVFTLSSHQPYKVPANESFDKIQAPHPILKAIAYTDSALEDFFKAASTQVWYQNTLFVLVGDHTGPQVTTEFEDKISAYRIPLLFFHSQIFEWPKEIDRQEMVQQMDIPASLYDFLDFKNVKSTVLSRSAFRPGPRTFTAYMPGLYIHTDGKTVLLEQKYNQQFLDFEHFKKTRPEDLELKKSLNAVKQIFSQGLWDNALYY